MRTFVTGGAGFIGSHLVDLLLDRGHDVTVLTKPGEPRDNLAGRNVRFVEGDVRDARVLDEGARGAEVVYHLAARTDLAGCDLADYDENVSGTSAIIEATRRAGSRRLLFVSSMLAVPLSGRSEPIDERADGESPSAYGQSKRAGERMLAESGIEYAVVRPTLVYGPRERSTMRAFFSAVYRRRFLLIGPDVLQSFVYVKNVVHAAYEASVHPGAKDRVFFVSDARAYTLAEFARAAATAFGVALWPVRLPRSLALAMGWSLDRVGGILGRELPLSVRRVRTMTTPYVYSLDATRRAFGYAPPYDLEAGVRETARWYLEQRLL